MTCPFEVQSTETCKVVIHSHIFCLIYLRFSTPSSRHLCIFQYDLSTISTESKSLSCGGRRVAVSPFFLMKLKKKVSSTNSSEPAHLIVYLTAVYYSQSYKINYKTKRKRDGNEQQQKKQIIQNKHYKLYGMIHNPRYLFIRLG